MVTTTTVAGCTRLEWAAALGMCAVVSRAYKTRLARRQLDCVSPLLSVLSGTPLHSQSTDEHTMVDFTVFTAPLDVYGETVNVAGLGAARQPVIPRSRLTFACPCASIVNDMDPHSVPYTHQRQAGCSILMLSSARLSRTVRAACLGLRRHLRCSSFTKLGIAHL